MLTEKSFNKTCFAENAKSVVFFNDVEDDDEEFDQYECFLQVNFILCKLFEHKALGTDVDLEPDGTTFPNLGFCENKNT